MFVYLDNSATTQVRPEVAQIMAKTTKAAGEPKLNVKRTILTGFGFLATSIAWAIYDPYITKILNKLLMKK